MSKEELLMEVLKLPVELQRKLVEEIIDRFPESEADPDMTPKLAAELNRRNAEILTHPERESSWEEVSARLLTRISPNLVRGHKL